MDTFIVGLICLVIIGGIGVYIAMKYDKAKEEIRWMKEQHYWETQRLNSQVVAANVQQSYAETEAHRLFQEQLNLKLDAMDACKAMLCETMRH